MKDVARAAGVHQATVSRALRNDPRISEDVRRRVRVAADALGYVPNPLLAALSTLRHQKASLNSHMTIAYVLRGDSLQQANNGHIASARNAAVRRGYKLEKFVIDRELHEERLNQILITRNIPGIILGPLPDRDRLFALEWERFCVVAIHNSFREPAFDRVNADNFHMMRVICAQCLRRGFTRVGLVFPLEVDDRNGGVLRAAYRLAVENERKLTALKPLILPAWDDCAFEKWIREVRPRVIVSSNTYWSRIEAWLKKAGWRVPRDIGLVNINVIDPEAQGHAGIHHTSTIGATAARHLIDKINQNERGIPSNRITLLTEGDWHEGNTLAVGDDL
ncbi:LacI family DNA-binding transcriptional regulator [Geminisphaera colitermitum]|uniref:LacI family DNA-binding transcriptional regulator n=1 Tax=Geminisphaera colitermitum TaxID=1148786 RepID=UPI0018E32B0A|nr:LacI family DNA-binding transcriptional regulator [Geminisphaera colitermitum]